MTGQSISVANWAVIVAQLEDRIAAVTASNNPDYSVAGRSISKAGYLSQLMTAYEKALVFRQSADGAWSVDSRGASA